MALEPNDRFSVVAHAVWRGAGDADVVYFEDDELDAALDAAKEQKP